MREAPRGNRKQISLVDTGLKANGTATVVQGEAPGLSLQDLSLHSFIQTIWDPGTMEQCVGEIESPFLGEAPRLGKLAHQSLGLPPLNFPHKRGHSWFG